MTTLNIIVYLLSAISLLLLVSSLRALWKRRFLATTLRLLFGVTVFSLVLGLSAISLNLYTYHRLTSEQEIATLQFRQIDDKDFLVYLTLNDGTKNLFELKGDQWQLSTRILKWPSWMNLLGIKTLYRLDRLTGIYQNIEQDRENTHSVYALAEDPGLDLWQEAEKYKRWLSWIDAIYGSAAYMPMKDGERYRISLSSTGLIARQMGR